MAGNMPKIPYKSDKSRDDDEDYEIVSFEDFCDKSPNCKTDLLTLNDNINYRLCYESDKTAKYRENEGESSSRDLESHTETSLSGPKNVTFKRKLSNSFAPFGRFNGKTNRGPLFSGVIPKPRNEGESSSREHRYQRFSESRNIFQRAWEHFPGMGSGVLGLLLLCALCIGAWWAASGAMGGTWGEEHYRKLWERAHPDNTKKPPTPLTYEKILPEHRYHDHNNLSTKNKGNATEFTRRRDYNKKSYMERTPEILKEMCEKIADNMRFDCFPRGSPNEKDCVNRGCCWNPVTLEQKDGIPYCFFPPQYDTFRFLNMTEDKHSTTVFYEKARPSGYPDDFEFARIDIKYLSDEVVQIKIYDAEHNRYEPPYPEIAMVPKPLTDMKLRVKIPEDGSGIGFKVIRDSDDVVIFDTEDVGGLILSDMMLQLSAVLPTHHIFGLGERRARFMIDMNWQTFALYNRDRKPIENANLYGTHPFYMGIEPGGNAHGVFLLNSNAMDVVVQPAPAITFRATGGVLNLLVMAGPTPAAVLQQYTAILGRPALPPYWALGFHLCKFNYLSLNATRDVWKRNRDAGIPFDVQWNDIDYMKNRNDFTYDEERFAGLPDFVDELHKEGMRYVMIIDPGISASQKPGTYPPYDRGIEMDVFIKNNTNQPLLGKVWNEGLTVYPDFTHPNATAYWVEMLTAYYKKVKYDGVWIDMNEPSNFVDGTAVGHCGPEVLPYRPHMDPLATHTLCADAKHHGGLHKDLHNIYGLLEARATNYALSEIRGKRPFIISRSSFAGLGRLAGHWSGDISSAWHDMRMTVPELLNFAIFGVPLMGADICGFTGDATPELCRRWMQLGAFYPFSRNHNSDTSKDPASMGAAVVRASRRALRLRYRLLPLYYTLFWRAHVFGGSVVRPLFFEWSDNEAVYDIDDQFMVGPYVMVTPILTEGATYATPYFPGSQLWYNIVDGAFLAKNTTRNVTEDQTVAVKGGAILPLQEPPVHGPVSTSNTRSSPMQLIVIPSDMNKAFGELYWDDGDSPNTYDEKKYSHIEFYLNRTNLTSVVKWWGYGVPPINNITVFAQPAVTGVTYNDYPCEKPRCQYAYIPKTKVLHIYNINVSMDKAINIQWSYKQNKRVAGTFTRLSG
ncbi:lysosomal alpha-glucosidase-like isoform X2 [Galleria mellonella]|uniref:Lysosomal alpha-glucosidase-like isoform X2 n=1 Tax=Galleria mellonella TaxID=7137 RepID=A0ABM3MF14_GALME|nr:lysosomal alpha-glucosidase-like isoform X2 [Galleria mellonella]